MCGQVDVVFGCVWQWVVVDLGEGVCVDFDGWIVYCIYYGIIEGVYLCIYVVVLDFVVQQVYVGVQVQVWYWVQFYVCFQVVGFGFVGVEQYVVVI